MPIPKLERIKTQGASAGSAPAPAAHSRSCGRASAPSPCIGRRDMVRDFVSDPAEQSATVDRFLDELDEMAPSSAVFSDAATARLRAASRQSVTTVVEQFDEAVAGLDGDALTKLSDDLASVVKLLRREPVLARHLAEPSDGRPPPRCSSSSDCCRARSTIHALDILKTAVSQRWSSSADLMRGIEHIARLALLVRAEADDQIEDVEEQLFRFGRILDSEPQLITLLSDYTSPLDGRISLLNNVLHGAGRARTPRDLLRRRSNCCTGSGRTRPSSSWPNLAVARRGEVVAHVRAASRAERRTTKPTDRVAQPHLRPPGVASAGRRPVASRRPHDRRRRRGDRRLARRPSWRGREPAARMTPTTPDPHTK